MHSLKTVLAVIASSAFVCVQLAGQENADLLDNATRDLLHEALSGELAKEHVIAITRFHRIQGSRQYRAAAKYVLQQLRSYGFSEKDAYIESYVSDGKATYQTWQSPPGWDISWGELRMIEPYDERIVGYPEIAMSVITYSNPGDVTSELVWVGDGTRDRDYSGKNVKDRIVLATGYGGSVHRLAVLKYGAKAVVCFLDDDRSKQYPDMLQYTGMWPRAEELSQVTFGFNLTNRQGTKLRDMLLSGKKVVLRARVKGIGLEPYFMDVVVAHFRGTARPDEELVFSAHLDHPKESANDNASGSGAILDIARTLKELTDNGRLSRPKRSIRFMWVPEWNGTMAYIDAHPELIGPPLGGTILANVNMDMVGENPELVHSKLLLTRTPASIPSCLNDVVENMTLMVDKVGIRTPRGSLSEFNYRITSYSGGSDHMMFIDRKIPGVMFSHTDYTHHTSEDTPDKVDPVELERCELIAAGTIWYLANISEQEARDLVRLTAANSLKRLAGDMLRAQRIVVDAPLNQLPAAWAQAENMLSYRTVWEGETLESILTFANESSVARDVASVRGDLKREGEFCLAGIRSLARERGAVDNKPGRITMKDRRVPVRLTRGPLDFGLPATKLKGSDSTYYSTSAFSLSGDERFELVNFIDGKRSVSDICDALSAEFKPLELDAVGHYLDDLVRVGVLRWRQ